MKEFLRKIKLIDSFKLQLPIEKSRFIENLKANVDEGDTGYFSGVGDFFDRSDIHYRGKVHHEGFKIKKKGKMFDQNMSMATTQGTYKKSGDGVLVEGEVNGFSRMMIPFYIFAALFYLMFFTILVSTDNSDSGLSFIGLPFLALHAIFMLGVPYFIMRRGVKRMKYDLEREFYFLTKK